MKRILLLCSAFVLFAANAASQKDQKEKPWTEWSEKEALKMMTDSAWAQSVTEYTEPPADGSAITATQSRNAAGSTNPKADSGETLGRKNAALSLKYHVAFLTAKPVRAAFIRLMELRRPDTPAERVAELRSFVEKDLGDYIVVSLIVDGTDRQKVEPAKKYLGGANQATFKDIAYLERKDGKRVALMDYKAPGSDPMGAKFVFPRTLEGQPFLDANSGEVRVYMEIGKTKLNRRFKIAEMMYGGKLEH